MKNIARLFILTATGLSFQWAGPAAAQQTGIEILIPAYFGEEKVAEQRWKALFEVANEVAITAIMDVEGGLGNKASEWLTERFKEAKSSKIRLVGYVQSDEGERSIGSVKSDIDRWFKFYPDLKGVFIDEQATGEDKVEYYTDLYKYIKKKHGDKLVITNPGIPCSEKYFSQQAADVICVYENKKFLNDLFFPKWLKKYTKVEKAVLGYGIKSKGEFLKWLAQARTQGFRFFYVTDDKGRTPGNRLPDYWDDMVKEAKR
ncbi:MAG: spherulation-specific family 4 protein [Verrucomicrobiota bacterium]